MNERMNEWIVNDVMLFVNLSNPLRVLSTPQRGPVVWCVVWVSATIGTAWLYYILLNGALLLVCRMGQYNYWDSLTLLYTPQRGPVVDVSYGSVQLLGQLGLDSEWIIVLLSSKGVNNIAYLAHMWPQLYHVLYCLSNSYAIFFRHNRQFNYRPQFQDWQLPQPLISHRTERRRHYRPKIKSRWKKLPDR